MELIPIGEAAQRLGLNASALRYYDERGLVPAHGRRGGRRWYSLVELRRLAFIKIAQRLGLPLDTAAAILDAPGPEWRQVVRQQLAELDLLIEQAHGARTFLAHALNCPSEHPSRDCPKMVAALDQLLNGGTVEQLADEHFYGKRRGESRPGSPTGVESDDVDGCRGRGPG